MAALTKRALADTIVGMSYGDLKEAAGELAQMIKDKDARPKLVTAEEFADLLFDWADAQREAR